MTLPLMLIARGVARGIHVAGSLSILGAMAANTFVLPAALRRSSADVRNHVARYLSCVIWISFVVAVSAAFFWLVLEAIYASGSDRLSDGLADLMPLIWDTNFGNLLIARLLLLTVAVGLFRFHGSRGRAIAVIGAAALSAALQAGLGHGAAMSGIEGGVLLAALVLHLLAAGLWLGGLLPLLIGINAASLENAYLLARRFSALGTICVLTLVITASVQAWFLMGGIAGLFGTAYGRVAMIKIFLFLVLIGLAACNRNLFTPVLWGSQGPQAKVRLSKSIAAEISIGLGVIILAGILLELPPGMDMAMAGSM